MKINTRKQLFIDAMAEYLTRDLAKRSIEIEMGKLDAQEWAKIYNIVGLGGYAKKEDAVKAMKEFLV
jgi:hypothetical protein